MKTKWTHKTKQDGTKVQAGGAFVGMVVNGVLHTTERYQPEIHDRYLINQGFTHGKGKKDADLDDTTRMERPDPGVPQAE